MSGDPSVALISTMMSFDSTQVTPGFASSDRSADGESSLGVDVAILLAIGVLWIQLYYSVIPVWIHGDYYEYGWFVPPAAAFFFFRRWLQRSRGEWSPVSSRQLVVVAGLLFPVILLIRALEGFDSSWRPPMLAHAGMAALLSHWMGWKRWGVSLSVGMLPVTAFALSAIPYPWQIERSVILELTDWVTQGAVALFNLMGRPVTASGGILECGGTKVEVTDGCSGIRSLQSLLMAALFFGEFFRIRMAHRFLLVGLASVVALLVNMGRAMYLAQIRFDEGEAAFHAAHDWVGHVAFAVSGLCLLLATRALIGMDGRRRRIIRSTQVKSS